jgi:hypothetical protein
MVRWILTCACAVLLMGQAQDKTPASQPAQTQSTTRPAPTNTVLRRPAQADILKNLLGRNERPTPIKPQEPQATSGPAGHGGGDEAGQAMLLEGTFLIERPGRLVREEGRAKFVFLTDGNSAAPRAMEIVPNQLLEMLERESEAGFSEFVISAEVTRYKGANYLILRKILRRVGHGNLTP